MANSWVQKLKYLILSPLGLGIIHVVNISQQACGAKCRNNMAYSNPCTVCGRGYHVSNRLENLLLLLCHRCPCIKKWGMCMEYPVEWNLTVNYHIRYIKWFALHVWLQLEWHDFIAPLSDSSHLSVLWYIMASTKWAHLDWFILSISLKPSCETPLKSLVIW